MELCVWRSVYGVQYAIDSNQPLHRFEGHNMPCAVCFAATRDTVLMVPAKLTCPTNWTVEYTGYLMAEAHQYYRSTYECVDKEPESVPGLDAWNGNSAFILHVEPNCVGLSCSSYDAHLCGVLSLTTLPHKLKTLCL